MVSRLPKLYSRHIINNHYCTLFVVHKDMTDANPIRFTLNDNTHVIVKATNNSKYDFELRLVNGNRKTFVWSLGMPEVFKYTKGKIDKLATEAVIKLKAVISNVV